MIHYHRDIEQGTEEWFKARCGILTASEMHLIVTPTFKKAANEKTRQHLFELLAQRVTGHVEPSYVGDDMIRGQVDEIEARTLYAEKFGEVEQVGFVTNDQWGFTLGYSPDFLIGQDGCAEVKSRRQKYQMETLVNGVVPQEYILQIQTGLLVTGRKWCDFISYCGGLYMFIIRVEADAVIQGKIIEAATEFEADIEAKKDIFTSRILSPDTRIIKTERKIEQEITI